MSLCAVKNQDPDTVAEEQEMPRKLISSDEISILSEFHANGILIRYLKDEVAGTIGLMLLPEDCVDQTVEHRDLVGNTRAWTVDSLVQVKCVGDPYPGLFCQGRTMRNSGSTNALKYVEQRCVRNGEETSVLTIFAHERGYRCEHRLTWGAGEPLLESTTTFVNRGDEAITLEMLSSFSLGGLTPFAADDAAGRLVLHRLRSAWCAEGRLESVPIERLQLEGFHYAHVAAGERFGQVGSMPVRGWFPFAVVEDLEAGVAWGAQLACPGSWQMELYRRDDMLSLSGGLADREFGHWAKTVAPGESFVTPTAILTTVAGDLDTLCARFLARQDRSPVLAVERDMPVVFNDWCTHWGKPDHHKIIEIADALKGRGVRYLVIDAGWFGDHGAWTINGESFPNGLLETAQEIRARGLTPGLWFEIETCETKSSEAAMSPVRLLRRDGIPIATPARHFWDFRDPGVFSQLLEKIVGTLKSGGFGYVKIDYNDTIGIGCDGAESLGEGLRQHLDGVQEFWRRIRERLPDLVIENCSSGGHRLEPSMMALADQNSFSDAHELVSIPIVAANLHRFVLPRKLQIWAVLRPSDSERRMVYSLAAAMLGRMGLSGDIAKLDGRQSDTLDRALDFYRKARPVIRDGFSRRAGPDVLSYRNPTQWQAVLRFNAGMALVVCHGFGSAVPELIEIQLPVSGPWRLQEVFQSSQALPEIHAGRLSIQLEGEWSACAILLCRDDHS